MRITFNSQYREAAAGIESASEQLIEYQRQVSTGRRVEKPSDDPAAASTLVSERAQLARLEQYSRTADTVSSRLAVADTVLSDIITKLTAAQSATMSARGSTKTAAEREAAAESLEGIHAALLDDFNTSFHGTFIFAGAASTTQPYTEGGGGAVNPYAGSALEVSLAIGDGRNVTVGFDGDSIVQGTDSASLFAELDALVAAVRAGDEAGITTGMDALGRAMARASAAQSRVGTGMQTVEGEQLRLQQITLAGMTRISALEDADMAEAVAGLTKADAAYRAALGAIGTASRVSLMDYLG